MLVSSTSGCCCNDFVDASFSVSSYNMRVCAVNAVRSYFGHRGVRVVELHVGLWQYNRL